MSDCNHDLSHEDMDHGITYWDGILDFGSEVYNTQTAGVNQEPFLMRRDLGAQDVVSNIHVYLVPATAVSLVEPQGDTLKITIEQGGVRSISFRDPRAVFVCAGRNDSSSSTKVGRLIGVVAHEVGHVIVGSGHPDSYLPPFLVHPSLVGVAPLEGTDTKDRLMHSGTGFPIRDLKDFGRQLVKPEWDEAEKWFTQEVVAGRMQ